MEETKKVSFVKTNEIATKEHNIYIIGEIVEVSEYIDMIDTLNRCEENDTVNVYVNSGGGYISTGVQIINAIQNCKANVTTILSGIAWSCGSMILCAGDKIKVMDHGSFMAHASKSGFYGGNREVLGQVQHEQIWIDEIDKALYAKILTEKEIEEISKDHKEIWLTSGQLNERLKLN